MLLCILEVLQSVQNPVQFRLVFDYSVQLCNLRGDSMSVRKKESQSRSLIQLINHLFMLISTEIKKAHRKCIRHKGFRRSYSKI